MKEKNPFAPKVSELLLETYRLISDPKCWTKHALARNKSGHEVKFDSKSAVKFCLHGALLRVGKDTSSVLTSVAYRVLRDALPFGFFSLTSFNDNKRTKHAEVLLVLDRAIKAAQAKELKAFKAAQRRAKLAKQRKKAKV
jgi:hypothetical protein